jgi:hypothetical protein
MLRMKRPSVHDALGKKKNVKAWPSGDNFAVRFPMLSKFLHDERWDDGTTRRTGTLLLFVEEGQLKACLSDRDGDCYVFISADSVDSLLKEADECADGESGDWRKKRK